METIPHSICSTNGDITFIMPSDLSLVFCVLGNIAAGKSSLVAGLKKILPNSIVASEPRDKWAELGIIQAYYEDTNPDNPNRGSEHVSAIFQYTAFSTRLLEYKRAMDKKPTFLIGDGHPLNDYHVFVKTLNMKDSQGRQMINDKELKWYEDQFKCWQELCPASIPAFFVYLRTSPEKCFERNRIRIEEEGRYEEKPISIEFLTHLHKRYEEMVKIDEIKDKLHIINGDKSKEDVKNDVIALMREACKLRSSFVINGQDIPFDHAVTL